jgi:hypothetical protein
VVVPAVDVRVLLDGGRTLEGFEADDIGLRRGEAVPALEEDLSSH